MMRVHRCIAALLAILAAPLAAGHDFWIEPLTFSPAAGELLKIRLCVGERLQGEAVPRKPDRIESFAVAGPGGETAVAGNAGAEPAGEVRLDKPGTHIIAYRSRRAFIELEAAKFEAYLREEGLEAIIERRAAEGQSQAPGREVYSRCAKAFVSVRGEQNSSSCRDAAFQRELGQPLELIPESNPCDVAAGDELGVHLVCKGKPLAGALIVALWRAPPGVPGVRSRDAGQTGGDMEVSAGSPEKPNDPELIRIDARTDERGRAKFKISRPGMWLIKCEHMDRAPAEAGADWESLWASLTFQARGRVADNTDAKP